MAGTVAKSNSYKVNYSNTYTTNFSGSRVRYSAVFSTRTGAQAVGINMNRSRSGKKTSILISTRARAGTTTRKVARAQRMNYAQATAKANSGRGYTATVRNGRGILVPRNTTIVKVRKTTVKKKGGGRSGGGRRGAPNLTTAQRRAIARGRNRDQRGRFK